MAEGDSDLLISDDKEIRALFLRNPFFTRSTDEIGETALVTWIVKSYHVSFGKKISKQEVLGSLLRMVSEDIILRKHYGVKVLVLPTRNFFLLKHGQPPVARARAPKGRTEEIERGLPGPPERPSWPPGTLQHPPAHQYHTYKEFLTSLIRSRPEHERVIIEHFPELYELACNILSEEHTDWHTRMMISAALGYYILEEDLDPDYQEHGYVDDLFILSYVLREIKKHVSPNLITSNWHYETDVMYLIDTAYAETYKILGPRACDVLHLVGLWKFKRLELEDYHGQSNEKIEILTREKRELLALVAYLVKIIYHADVSKKSLDYIKQYLKTFGDHDEINRIVVIACRGFDFKEAGENAAAAVSSDLDDRLQKALIGTLLED